MAQLLSEESKQLHLFLTGIRSVGEEKSELFPEPQYFTAAFASAGANMPYTIAKILERCEDAAAWGRRCKRVLSPTGAVQMPGIPWIVNWAREILLLEKNVPGQRPGMIFDDGEVVFSDADVGACMRFAKSAVEQYRSDGFFYPSPTQALGSNFRILPEEEANTIAANTRAVNISQANEILALMAAVRALSFLMESETREALMMHGPYPVGEDGNQLIFFECCDLRWSLWPNFPLSGNAKWELPSTPLPYANLAIALVLKDVTITADRVGTLYIDGLAPDKLVSASFLTRGQDELRDDGLAELDLAEARSLRERCDDIQAFMFLQLAGWNRRQRMEAAVRQEETLLLRMLASAGYDRSEIEREQQILSRRHERVWGSYFDTILECPSDKLPFFAKLREFISGNLSELYNPLVLTAEEKNYTYESHRTNFLVSYDK